jgi:hypothetical protein
VLVKFVLSFVGTLILLVHMRAVSNMARIAAETTLSRADYGMPRLQLVVHAVGGLLVLLTATALSVYKPWGKTRYGKSPTGVPKALYVVLGIIALVLLVVVLHLTGHAPRGH